MIAPRAYCATQDLEAMLEVLAQGRKADNGSYYIHPGDLKWWLYYPPLGTDYWEHLHLWDDPMKPGRLLGWALISPDWVGIDVYVRPELRGSEVAREMYVWAEQEARCVASRQSKKTISATWIRHDDTWLVEHFTNRGFRPEKGITQLQCALDEVFPAAKLPAGYRLRGCKGEAEVASRAKAQYGAFSSPAPFDKYLARFTKFMQSVVYTPDLDIVVEAPDGRIAAFCIVWTDPINRVGLFEPVGTHPDYQRKGLGRAVMLEGMYRLKQRGMVTAIVSTGEDHQPAIKLYESVGFRVVYQLGTYEKDV